MVIWLVLTRVQNEEISYWRLGSCVSWTCFRERGKGGTSLEYHVLFSGLLLGGANVEKQGDYQEKKFFIDNTVQVLIPFKEKHRGLLKLHVQLGEGVSL